MRFVRSDSVTIGGKRVPVRKITIAQWRELFSTINVLPQLLISVLSAPQSERAGYFVVAVRESLEDVTRITALLTGLEQEWIEQNGALDELAAFLLETAKVNNFAELLKNVRGVLGPFGINPAKPDAGSQ